MSVRCEGAQASEPERWTDKRLAWLASITSSGANVVYVVYVVYASTSSRGWHVRFHCQLSVPERAPETEHVRHIATQLSGCP